MINELLTVSPAFVLEATSAVHNAIKDDDGFAGYDGSEFAFLSLYAEVKAIVSQLIHPEVCDLDNVVATFFEVQAQIAAGELDCDWHL
jgi:hypothetical protein